MTASLFSFLLDLLALWLPAEHHHPDPARLQFMTDWLILWLWSKLLTLHSMLSRQEKILLYQNLLGVEKWNSDAESEKVRERTLGIY